MTMNFDRRQLMLAGLAGTTLLLPGCQSAPRISLAPWSASRCRGSTPTARCAGSRAPRSWSASARGPGEKRS